MEGLKVRCHTCGLVLYETTDKYTCHKPLTGDMLRLLPLYKDWPCYDGSLAVSSTPRFLMFCSACAGYIATPVGGLRFVDFNEGPHVVSQERSDMPYNERPFLSPIPLSSLSNFIGDPAREPYFENGDPIDNLMLPIAEDSALSDDFQKIEFSAMTPDEVMNEVKMKGQSNTPKPKCSRKGKR